MDDRERYEEICQPAFASIEGKVDEILRVLKGANDTPGLCERVRNLEKARATNVKLFWAVIIAILAQIASWVKAIVT